MKPVKEFRPSLNPLVLFEDLFRFDSLPLALYSISYSDSLSIQVSPELFFTVLAFGRET
jgi:hypothetical protein